MLRIALSVALGGFLMGFDASVISGVVVFIQGEFALSDLQLGWVVASLTLASTFAMMTSGPLSDAIGRRATLRLAAIVFLVSAIWSALATSYEMLVAARLLGGLGVGAALIIAPMYIAELAPADRRGQLVSMNQLNIVIGISAAFFSNYLIVQVLGASMQDAGSDAWRWMLGVEALPALLYLVALAFVPESPRWLAMRGRQEEARAILESVGGDADTVVEAVQPASDASGPAVLLDPRLRLVLGIGLLIAVLQQISGINAVFFYAPMIFQQAGAGTDAAFLQAVLVGLVNLVFTVIALMTIDRLGRRPLLLMGTAGVALSMLVLAWAFSAATYEVTPAVVQSALQGVDDPAVLDGLTSLAGRSWADEAALRVDLAAAIGPEALQIHGAALVQAATQINAALVLGAMLTFVASFAVSLGPVMWVLLSELFPNHARGYAISLAGLANSGVSFGVQYLFPWELANLGSATTFLVYGVAVCVGWVLVFRYVPETRNLSLEELEAKLAPASGVERPED